MEALNQAEQQELQQRMEKRQMKGHCSPQAMIRTKD